MGQVHAGAHRCPPAGDQGAKSRLMAQRSDAGGTLCAVLIVGCLALGACGGGGSGSSAPPSPEPPPEPVAPLAEVFSTNYTPIEGLPFAQRATVAVSNPAEVEQVQFRVATRPGNASEDVRVSYSLQYLRERAGVDDAGGELSFTVFGLYADYQNDVTVTLLFTDGSSSSDNQVLATPPFESEFALPDPVLVQRTPGLDFGFFMVQRSPVPPTVFDIDGEVRWQHPWQELPRVGPAIFRGDHFLVGSVVSPEMYRVYWDGSYESYRLSDSRVTNSHHNIEAGKRGILHEVGFNDENLDLHLVESVLVEATAAGEVVEVFHFDEILSETIRAAGEDPAALVQSERDWFHMNSAIYDPADNSIIASSREHFVIKVDYDTREVIWIFGDREKVWYTDFPLSLRPLALETDGIYPVGQHTLSVNDEGELLLFNNQARENPIVQGSPALDYSTVNRYRIDAVERIATQTFNFDNHGLIWSPFCSGAYDTAAGDILINYSFSRLPDGASSLFIVDEEQEVLFEMYILWRAVTPPGCTTAYLSQEISLQDLRLDTSDR